MSKETKEMMDRSVEQVNEIECALNTMDFDKVINNPANEKIVQTLHDLFSAAIAVGVIGTNPSDVLRHDLETFPPDGLSDEFIEVNKEVDALVEKNFTKLAAVFFSQLQVLGVDLHIEQ